MSSLEDSEKLVAKIVAALAENGVLLRDISVASFFAEPTDQECELFEYALAWLLAENVVRRFGYERDRDDDRVWSHQCVLTAHGFAQLSTNFSNGLTLGTAVKRISDGGSGFSGVGDLIGGVLGGFTKSISGS